MSGVMVIRAIGFTLIWLGLALSVTANLRALRELRRPRPPLL